jgi:hypothetical protein
MALDFFVVFLGPPVVLGRFLGFWVTADVSASWSMSMAEAESVVVGGLEVRVEDP